ncbi:MarR family winged helix-turn-helix transcriptional regulator [uncultured Arthrobacter sp.]|uniref:MarR family winged helix-turn-helix transcriptional regulator n=1 Tax=uncultured Arthrobacter sp. TaxID=114050 RepID=UPI00261F9A08|nr:MarR family transcriptional regulator [uncultured Arthrobacter sp.]
MSNLDQWLTARLVITAGRLVENAYNEDLAAYGVTYAGLTILSVLAIRGALSQVQLAEELKIQSQTLGKTVGILTRKGFVARSRRRPDKRSQIVTITPTGQDLLKESRSIEEKLKLPEALRQTSLREHARTVIQTFERRK